MLLVYCGLKFLSGGKRARALSIGRVVSTELTPPETIGVADRFSDFFRVFKALQFHSSCARTVYEAAAEGANVGCFTQLKREPIRADPPVMIVL
jgi:hypothetical protein